MIASHNAISGRPANKANIINISAKVKFAESLVYLMEPTYGTYLSSITEEDVRRVKEGFEKLSKADEKTQKEFFDRIYTRLGVYDKDGNITEEYRNLF